MVSGEKSLCYNIIMKKIILLPLMLIFTMQFCFAQEPSTQSTEQSTQTQQVQQTEQAEPEETYEEIMSYFNTEQEPQQEPEQEQTTLLQGHLEYNLEDAKQEEIQMVLDESTERNTINISKPQKMQSKSLLATTKAPIFQPIQDELKSASKFSSQEYNIKSFSTDYSKRFGRFSVGTMYNSSLSKATTGHSTALFARYDGKHAAFSMGFTKSTNNQKDSFSDSFFIAPELKITNRLSLVDVIETDVYQINKSNELVLRYTPHLKKYADGVQFELGAGQSFYEDNFIKSSVRFSTKFRL